MNRIPRGESLSEKAEMAKAKRRDTRLARFYPVDGQDLVSVTSILDCLAKPALVRWAATQERELVKEVSADLYGDVHGTPQMSRPTYLATLDGRIGKLRAHQRELQKAAEIGSQTHALIEYNLRRLLGQKVGPEPRVTDKAMWAFMSWEDWAKKVALKPLLIEQTVFSLTHGYAGTLDLLAEVEGVVTVCDWKTGKDIYKESRLQNAAYRVALAEMGHGSAERGLVLRLPKLETDPDFEPVEVEAVEELFPTFLALKQVWKWWYEQELAYQERREKKV